MYNEHFSGYLRVMCYVQENTLLAYWNHLPLVMDLPLICIWLNMNTPSTLVCTVKNCERGVFVRKDARP
ncbi:hypothetical protein BRADI_2g54613v3 [Brachypodium distachyon]|uniref:Uncharacterized protein n=1 Tax=Brachypodium distachyon TaxID=15368 RepID=A0A2K2DFW0_BRADI|nr:hypothetical protein BRADI_2g54613v3 [Brachypodium distachyon]